MSAVAYPNGLRWPTGDPIGEPISFEDLARRAAGDADRLADAPTPASAPWTFGELAPYSLPNPSDPVSAGWAIVVGADDAAASERLAALGPLIEHRNAQSAPVLRYPTCDELDRANWIDEHYLGLRGDRPGYLLLAGDPVNLPFELQASLASAGASVGRVDFDDPADLVAYVAKVVAQEKATQPINKPEALVFATDGGRRDATYYSARYLAQPVADDISTDPAFAVTKLIGDEATKDNLVSSFTNPFGLVFTASHGMAATPADGLATQRRVNGAWCCKQTPGQPLESWLLAGDDIPADDPVWPGSVVIQFACWGYGTPTTSTFAQWMGRGLEPTADQPFVGAIPKKLLANPNGPIGYVGHVDTSFLHGFDDPSQPVPDDVYSPRLEPMLTLVERTLLIRTAAGYGLQDFVSRADMIAGEVSDMTNDLRNKHTRVEDLDPEMQANLADRMIRRNDAIWFLFFGDPAVHVRIGT